jgi:WD40 repeat protein
MQTKDGNIHEDEEIFYEAEENIRTSSLKQNNTHKESLGKENKIFSKSNNPKGNYNLLVSKNVINKIENEDEEKIVSPLKKRDTIYEDAEDHITEKLTDLEEFGIIPSENNMISISDSKIKSELNPFDKFSCNDFEKSSFDEDKKGKGKSRKEKQRERKLEILNQDLKDIKIDIEFLKKNLRQIPTKLKGIKEKHLQMLFELQSFQGDSQQIWTTKISFDGRYIATGGKSGVLKIFEILTEEESLDNYEFLGLLSYFKLINEHAYRIYTEHTQDIIDICWSSIVSIF